jgi:hypothetical protein
MKGSRKTQPKSEHGKIDDIYQHVYSRLGLALVQDLREHCHDISEEEGVPVTEVSFYEVMHRLTAILARRMSNERL